MVHRLIATAFALLISGAASGQGLPNNAAISYTRDIQPILSLIHI